MSDTGSRWQLDQWRPLHVITTAYAVLRTTPPKLLRTFILLAKYPPYGGHFANVQQFLLPQWRYVMLTMSKIPCRLLRKNPARTKLGFNGSLAIDVRRQMRFWSSKCNEASFLWTGDLPRNKLRELPQSPVSWKGVVTPVPFFISRFFLFARFSASRLTVPPLTFLQIKLWRG